MTDWREAQEEHHLREAQIEAESYIPSVVEAKYAGRFSLRLIFDDGTEGDADLFDLTTRSGKFAALADEGYFRQFYLDNRLHTVAWPNGLDLAPESLYQRVMKSL